MEPYRLRVHVKSALALLWAVWPVAVKWSLVQPRVTFFVFGTSETFKCAKAFSNTALLYFVGGNAYLDSSPHKLTSAWEL